MPPIDECIEIRVKGRRITVPALDVNGNTVIVKGKLLKVAVVYEEDWLESELEDPEQYVKKLKDSGSHPVKADIFAFTQKLPATRPKYSYHVEWESVAAVHLTSFKEWWEGLSRETRKNVRRSQKRGVVVKIREFDDDLIRGIKEVNDDSPVRQRACNRDYGKSFEETKKVYGTFTNRSDFICAYFGDELIGFLKLVYRGSVASILNLSTKPRHNDKRPANVLVAKAMELCGARGISHITYGLFNYGNKHDSPLREFKIRNGFGEIPVPRFFVPLTRWGRLCMGAKFHRGLLGILPHSVITFGVRVRAIWFDLKRAVASNPSLRGSDKRRGSGIVPVMATRTRLAPASLQNRYLRARMGISIDKVAQEDGVSQRTVGRSIERVEPFRQSKSVEFVNRIREFMAAPAKIEAKTELDAVASPAEPKNRQTEN